MLKNATEAVAHHERNIRSNPGETKLYLWLADDEFHKANYSGGENHHVELPNPHIDFPVFGLAVDEVDRKLEAVFGVDEDFGPNEFFTNHLRTVCRSAGFRGRYDPERHARKPPEFDLLEEIKPRIEPF